MGDEGVGTLVAQFLLKRKLPEGIECIDGGTGGFHLLEYIQKASTVILIDATIDGNELGTISCIQPRFSSDYPKSLTAHDIGLKDMIDVYYLSGKVPEIKLYAVSVSPPNEPTLQISLEIRDIIPEIAEMVLAEAKQYLQYQL